MPARFSATHEAAAASNLTLIQLQYGALGRRVRLYELEIGSDSAPAEFSGQFDVIRGTVVGTGTSISPRALDPSDNLAEYSLVQGATITGHTKTADSSLLSIGLHQRQTFRWLSHIRRAIIVPGTVGHWVGIECIAHGGTPNINTTIHWES
jgi:hypothetical protein